MNTSNVKQDFIWRLTTQCHENTPWPHVKGCMLTKIYLISSDLRLSNVQAQLNNFLDLRNYLLENPYITNIFNPRYKNFQINGPCTSQFSVCDSYYLRSKERNLKNYNSTLILWWKRLILCEQPFRTELTEQILIYIQKKNYNMKI